MRKENMEETDLLIEQLCLDAGKRKRYEEIKDFIDTLDIETVTKWDPAPVNDCRILTAPNIPKPLHGLAPRVIVGATTWNQMRKACYESAHYTCEACGYTPDRDNREYTHAHEVYQIDYDKCESIFHRTICLCPRCVDADTEVLTSTGWKKIPDVTLEDKVACFNKDDESIVFDNPLAIHIQKHENAVRIKGNGAELIFSENHRLPLRIKSKRSSKDGKITDVLAGDYTPSHYYNWVLSGDNNNEEHLTDEERVYIAIEADGHIAYDKENTGRGDRTRGYSSRYGSENYRYTYVVSLSKTRKIERLKKLLESSGMKYKITKETSNNYCDFNIWSNKDLKHFSNCFSFDMGKEKALEFIEELVFWDGTYSGQSTTWFTNKPEEVAFVQAIAAQCSIRTSVSVVNRIGNIRKGEWKTPYERLTYAVSFRSINNEFTGRGMVPEKIKWGKELYCLTTSTSYFLARKDNLVFVTGNCHLLCIHTGRALTLYKRGNPSYTADKLLAGAEHCFTIINNWNKEHPDQEPLRVFNVWLDYLKYDELFEPMKELIKKYDVKFYRVSNRSEKPNKWGKWRLKVFNKWHKTPYENVSEWEKAMEEKSNDKYDDHNVTSSFKGKVYDELDKFLKENNNEQNND